MLKKTLFALVIMLVSPFAAAEFHAHCDSSLQSIIISGGNDFLKIRVNPGQLTNITEDEQTFQALTNLGENGIVQVSISSSILGPVSFRPRGFFGGRLPITVTLTPVGDGCDLAISTNDGLLPFCSASNFSLVCLDSPNSAYPVKLKLLSLG